MLLGSGSIQAIDKAHVLAGKHGLCFVYRFGKRIFQANSGSPLYCSQIQLTHLLAPFSFWRPVIPLTVALLRLVPFPLARMKNSLRVLCHFHLILFSLKTIALPRVEVSRLRARPKGFPIALWKPSGRPFDAMLLMQNSISFFPCHSGTISEWQFFSFLANGRPLFFILIWEGAS